MLGTSHDATAFLCSYNERMHAASKGSSSKQSTFYRDFLGEPCVAALLHSQLSGHGASRVSPSDVRRFVTSVDVHGGNLVVRCDHCPRPAGGVNALPDDEGCRIYALVSPQIPLRAVRHRTVLGGAEVLRPPVPRLHAGEPAGVHPACRQGLLRPRRDPACLQHHVPLLVPVPCDQSHDSRGEGRGGRASSCGQGATPRHGHVYRRARGELQVDAVPRAVSGRDKEGVLLSSPTSAWARGAERRRHPGLAPVAVQVRVI